jgi:hypothetical protein
MGVIRSGRPGEDQDKLEKNWPFKPPQREYNKDMGCKGKGKPKPKGK